MTPLKVSIAASIASVILLLIVLELIRSRRLRERYALLWLLTGVVLLALSLWRGGLNTIADWVGVDVPARDPVRRCCALHPCRAAALLDGDLEALGSELDPRAAARAARGAGRTVRLRLGASERLLAVPGDRALEPLAKRRPRLEAEQLARARRVDAAPRLAVRPRRVPGDASLEAGHARRRARRGRGSRSPCPAPRLTGSGPS